MPIEAIFFDLDQTLVDRAATFDRYLSELFSDLTLSAEGITEQQFKAAVYVWDDNGYRSKPDTFGRALAALSVASRLDAVLTHFEQNYGHQARLFTGVQAVLTQLQPQYRLAVVSNGRTRGQLNKLQATGIAHCFERLFISQQVGMKKPEPEIYLQACKAMGVAPEEVLFVGDHPRNDVDAPAALGMRTIWIINQRYSEPGHAHGRIHSVAELPDLL